MVDKVNEILLEDSENVERRMKYRLALNNFDCYKELLSERKHIGSKILNSRKYSKFFSLLYIFIFFLASSVFIFCLPPLSPVQMRSTVFTLLLTIFFRSLIFNKLLTDQKPTPVKEDRKLTANINCLVQVNLLQVKYLNFGVRYFPRIDVILDLAQILIRNPTLPR